MPGFVSADPEAFYNSATKRMTFFHHEAGHLLLAYYYGFEIAGFYFAYRGGELTGFVKNRPSPAVKGLPDSLGSARRRAQVPRRRALGRIHCGAPTDRMVFVLKQPEPETVTSATPFADLHPVPMPGQDTFKAVLVYVDNKIKDNWWQWLWGCHDEAEQILRQYWPLVQKLARAPRCDPALRQFRGGGQQDSLGRR